MAEMGRYCKAYLARDLRRFPGWSPDLSRLRAGTGRVDGREGAEVRTELADDDILYLQENFTVTDGILLDQDVVFAEVSDAWIAFCTDTLQFRVPVEELEPEEPAAESPAAAEHV